MGESPSKRDQQREERRGQILRAALEVFGQKGYYASNVSDVAAVAGVSQGTIYWYFESKEELLEAALLSLFRDFGDQSLEMLAHYDNAADKLLALGELMGPLMEDFGGAFTLFLEYWASSSERGKTVQLWTQLLAQYKDVFVQIIEDGIQRGEFRPVVAEELVWALMAAMDGLAAYAMLMPGLDFSATMQVLIETLLPGLLAEAS
jgi:AcrR family transcriptional regulator